MGQAAVVTCLSCMTVSPEQIRQRLAMIEARRRHYEWQSGQAGALARQETWRHAYLAQPYLIGAPDDRVADRFCDVFMNTLELGKTGLVQPVPLTENDTFIQMFAHLDEEYAARVGGPPPDDLIARARAPIVGYFEQGKPRGVTMFEGYEAPTTPILVKYGRRAFLEPMFRTGELRLANAGLYSQTGLLDSIRDDETSRTFFIPTWRDRLEGRRHVQAQGHTIEFGDDDLALPVVFDDYYLFSVCERIHHRMANDFDADAAIVIRDPERFRKALTKAVLEQRSASKAMSGRVTYYDPYRDYAKVRIPEMAKPFRYAYQLEVRFVFKPRRRPRNGLQPMYLSIGSMTDYADLIPAKA